MEFRNFQLNAIQCSLGLMITYSGLLSVGISTVSLSKPKTKRISKIFSKTGLPF